MAKNIEDVYNLVKNTLPSLDVINKLRTQQLLMKQKMEGFQDKPQVDAMIDKAFEEKSASKLTIMIVTAIITIATSIITVLAVKGMG